MVGKKDAIAFRAKDFCRCDLPLFADQNRVDLVARGFAGKGVKGSFVNLFGMNVDKAIAETRRGERIAARDRVGPMLKSPMTMTGSAGSNSLTRSASSCPLLKS